MSRFIGWCMSQKDWWRSMSLWHFALHIIISVVHMSLCSCSCYNRDVKEHNVISNSHLSSCAWQGSLSKYDRNVMYTTRCLHYKPPALCAWQFGIGLNNMHRILIIYHYITKFMHDSASRHKGPEYVGVIVLEIYVETKGSKHLFWGVTSKLHETEL